MELKTTGDRNVNAVRKARANGQQVGPEALTKALATVAGMIRDDAIKIYRAGVVLPAPLQKEEVLEAHEYGGKRFDALVTVLLYLNDVISAKAVVRGVPFQEAFDGVVKIADTMAGRARKQRPRGVESSRQLSAYIGSLIELRKLRRAMTKAWQSSLQQRILRGELIQQGEVKRRTAETVLSAVKTCIIETDARCSEGVVGAMQVHVRNHARRVDTQLSTAIARFQEFVTKSPTNKNAAELQSVFRALDAAVLEMTNAQQWAATEPANMKKTVAVGVRAGALSQLDARLWNIEAKITAAQVRLVRVKASLKTYRRAIANASRMTRRINNNKVNHTHAIATAKMHDGSQNEASFAANRANIVFAKRRLDFDVKAKIKANKISKNTLKAVSYTTSQLLRNILGGR